MHRFSYKHLSAAVGFGLLIVGATAVALIVARWETFENRLSPRATGALAVREAGREILKSRVVMVFDEQRRETARRVYSVWRSQPNNNLQFEWTPRKPVNGTSGPITGSGVLVWRRRNASAYDNGAVVSVYRGDMKEGRQHGIGTVIHRDGRRYEGAWRRGLYEGRGHLQLADGANYAGQFKSGRFEGEGRLILPGGEIYEGPFKNGYKHGIGATRLPSGVAYRSTWRNGKEDTDSRHVRLAQGMSFGATPVQFTAGARNVSFVLRVEQWPFNDERSFEPLGYNLELHPGESRILPDDKELMNSWRGTSVSGTVTISEGYFAVPLTVRMKLFGDSDGPLTVKKAYLNIEESLTDWQPLYTLYYPPIDEPCGGQLTRFAFRNHGWGIPPRVRLEYVFSRPPGSALGLPTKTQPQTAAIVSKPLGSVVHDFAQAIATYGVNLDKLNDVCKGLNDKACAEKAHQSGGLGRFGGMAAVSGGHLKTRVSGRLHFAWTDARRKVHPAAVPYAFDMYLSDSPNKGICPEAGSPPDQDPSTRINVAFPLDKLRYKINLPYRRRIDSGGTATMQLLLSAERSSQHRFRIVLEGDDGKTYQSQSIALTFFSPRVNIYDFHMRPFEETDEELGMEP